MAGTSDTTGQDSTSGKQDLIKATLNSLWTYLSSLIAGERLSGSASGSYLVVREECNATILNKNTAYTVGAGAVSDTHVMGYRVLSNMTGDLVITGFADDAGVARTLTLTTPTAGYYEWKASINAGAAATFTAANVADLLKVVIYWRPRV